MKHILSIGVAGAFYLASAVTSTAQESVELEPFSVKGDDGPFIDTPLVGNTSFVTSSELENINAINVEDTIKYLPNLNIRKRYIGDTNGVTSIRGQNTWMTGRSLVTVDGILLSNFLQTRWSGSPRWSAVSVDEVEYAEIEYGPYSAFKSGNSLGGSINLVTRMPQEKEGTLKLSYFSQDFSLYGTDDSYDGYKLFASYAERVGKLSLYAFYNHLENESHPQSYGDATATEVTDSDAPIAIGTYFDIDPEGNNRAIYSSYGPDELEHDQFKLKARYELTEDIQVQFSATYWKNDSEQTDKDSYITDEEGNTLWSGTYQTNGYEFTVKGSDFSVNQRQREDILAGLTLGGTLAEDWEFDVTLSYFDVIKDENRSSSLNPLDPDYDGSGRVTWFDDTSWLTLDGKIGSNQFLGNENISLFAGYHFSDYSLDLLQSSSDDWENGTRDAIQNNNGGESQMNAVFIQAGAKLNENWRLIAGGRYEKWETKNGYLQNSTVTESLDGRDQSEFSPKLSLEYQPNESWKATLNLAKAYRFPLVPELFQGRIGNSGLERNNPDLLPEDSENVELSLTHLTENGQIRFTLFHDEVKDAIFNLLDVTNSSNTFSWFLNIDEVKTEGIEFVFDQRAFLVEALDLRFNASYTESTIEKNSANTSFEGNLFPRIPKWRINLHATYNLSDNWDLSLGGRHQSHSFNNLENDDFGNNYGSISKFLVFDTRLSYRFGENKNSSVSLGIDNLFDEEYYVSHPYPQRTFFVESTLKF
ncbi:TonB-dependent receptor [Puniceicoccaceae bacterium K14]|nr:TonB-dependent receptor [Puniceicoccaceae bacterium K14]